MTSSSKSSSRASTPQGEAAQSTSPECCPRSSSEAVSRAGSPHQGEFAQHPPTPEMEPQLETTTEQEPAIKPDPSRLTTPEIPAPGHPSYCYICERPTTKCTTHWANKKNADRIYYKCFPCDEFLCFADKRGNDHRNPLCKCGESSKAQEENDSTDNFYSCRLGRCDFFKRAEDGDGGARDVVGITARFGRLWV